MRHEAHSQSDSGVYSSILVMGCDRNVNAAGHFMVRARCRSPNDWFDRRTNLFEYMLGLLRLLGTPGSLSSFPAPSLESEYDRVSFEILPQAAWRQAFEQVPEVSPVLHPTPKQAPGLLPLVASCAKLRALDARNPWRRADADFAFGPVCIIFCTITSIMFIHLLFMFYLLAAISHHCQEVHPPSVGGGATPWQGSDSTVPSKLVQRTLGFWGSRTCTAPRPGLDAGASCLRRL